MRCARAVLLALLGFAALGLAAAPTALAATDTWTGLGADDNWTTDANWSAGKPNPGDDLSFPSNAARLSNNNDFAANTSFLGIVISGSGYTLSGHAVKLSAGVATTNTSGTNTVALPITLTAPATFQVSGASATLMLTGDTDLSGQALAFASTGTTQMQGVLKNTSATTAGITKSGSGTLVLSATNTYDGTTTISAGTVRLTNTHGLGSGGAGATVQSGAALALGGGITVADPLTLNGAGSSGSGALTTADGTANTWSGAITLASNSTVRVSTGSLTLSSAIGGSGDLTKTGSNTLKLSGNNTYTGATSVSAGTLQITSATALGDSATGTTVQSGATLAVSGGITVTELLTLNGAGFISAGALQNGDGGTNTWLGAITLASDSAVGAAAGTLQIGGIIGGSGGLTKAGAGVVRLQGTSANTYAGATIVNDGTLALHKTAGIAAVPGSVTVNDGGALTLEVDNQVPDTAAVTLTSAGTFNVDDQVETIGSLAGAGSVSLGLNPFGGGGTLTVGGDNTSTTFSGILSSIGKLTKVGTGTLTLSGANTYIGATTVSGGTLQITNASALGASGGGTTVQSGGTLAVGGGITVAEPLTLNGAGVSGAGALVNADGASNSWSGAITLASDSAVGGAAGTLQISGVVGGSGGLTKTGAGAAGLAAGNGYTGPTTVAAGTLAVFNSNALGSGPAGVTVQSGATLSMAATSTIGKALTLNGSGVGGTGALQVSAPGPLPCAWSGPITLASDTTIGVSGSVGVLEVTGVISGNANLTKVGSFTLLLAGASANTYTGTTTVAAGNLDLGGTAGVAMVPGPLVIGAGATARLGSDNQIADSAAVTVNSTGTLALLGHAETIGSLAGAGDVGLSNGINAGTLTVGADNTSTAFSGVISGTGGALVKTGSGTLTLSGTNTYTGPTTVQAGTLLINGSQPNSPISLAGGTLGGTGSAGPINATGGTLAPGQSPGVLASGSLTLSAASTLAVELNGTTAGTFDQVSVTGGVSLGGAALNVSLGFTPLLGTIFTIVANDGADAVTGTFAGLPQGAILTASGVPLQISYAGGTGSNDVTLAVLASPTPTPTRTPTPTATPTATPAVTSTPTATPFPRPNVGVQVAPGGGVLQTTITARDAGCNNNTQNNQLFALQFTQLTNATVDVATSPVTAVSTPTTVALPSHPASIGLTVHRLGGQAATVALTVTDGCGTWPTFVGGGPGSF